MVHWLQCWAMFGYPGSNPVEGTFVTWTQSQRQVFGSVREVTWGNLVPPFRFVALFFACARDDCALSEYPKSADCFNGILEKRHRFWAGSPRKMAKPAHSQIGGFGGVGGGTWSHRFSLWRFFLHVHGKTVHFLNIQKAPIASTTFLKSGPVSGRGHSIYSIACRCYHTNHTYRTFQPAVQL